MGIRKEAIYPVQEWEITEKSFDKETNYRNETTFSLSNGYIGTRGTYEEAYPFDVDTGLEGNFVNGFYESEKIRYGEANFGSPLLSQSLLNLPNLKETRVYLDDEEFSMDTGKTEEYDRTLYMKDGVLEYYAKMSDLEEELQGQFCRVHKGYLINLSYVDEYNKTEVTLTNGDKLLISKYKYEDFVKAYLRFMQ